MIIGTISVFSIFAGMSFLIFDSSETFSPSLENILTLPVDPANYQVTNKSQLPIRISSDDFVNGIHFTDLNAIEGVSQEKVIVIDGILEYVD